MYMHFYIQTLQEEEYMFLVPEASRFLFMLICSESYVDIMLGLHVDELVLVWIGKEKNYLPIKSATVSVITWFNFLCLGSHIWWLHWVPIALRFGIRILTSGCLDWMDPLFSYGMVKQKQINPSWLTQAIVQTTARRWCPLIQLITEEVCWFQ